MNVTAKLSSDMAFTTSDHKYVQLNDVATPIISGSNMKVVELVTAQKAYGWSPEEIHFQHPYLSMSQIYSALAYYWDHKNELDADIERRLEQARQLKNNAETFLLADKLRSQGLLS